MPIQLRGTTLTAAASPQGIYVYTKAKNGRITEARNDISQYELAAALSHRDARSSEILNHSIRWTHEELDMTCSPQSTLCGVAWDSHAQSIFYQDNQGFIREWRKLDDSDWEDSDFVQPRGLKGTNIAVVHSKNGNRALLFYQDEEKFVCCRSAKFREWGEPVRIAKAAESTGIGATSWKGLNEVRLYFQDESLLIREYSGSPTTPFAMNRDFSYPLASQHPIGDITAISWEVYGRPKIRLYLQDAADDIIEYAMDEEQWHTGSLKQPCFPNADIIALPREFGPGSGCCINMFWVGDDQKLHQRVNSGSEWRESHSIMKISDVGMFAGSLSGTKFSDDNEDADTRLVRSVLVRVLENNQIGSIAFKFADDTATPLRGGKTGTVREFVLEEDEDIMYLAIVPNAEARGIQGLMFGTSKGRESGWFGQEDQSRKQTWHQSGHPLTGFVGAVDSDGILTGLGPIWATRTNTTNAVQIQTLIIDAENLNKGVIGTMTSLAQLRTDAVEFKRMTQQDLLEDAARAMDSIVGLTRYIEHLNDLARPTRLPYDKRRLRDIDVQRDACSKEADVVEVAFQDVVVKTNKCRTRGQELLNGVQELSVTFRIQMEKLDPLRLGVIAVRTMLQTDRDQARNDYEEMLKYVKLAPKNLGAAALKRMTANVEQMKKIYEDAKRELDALEEQLRALESIHSQIEQLRRDIDVGSRDVKRLVEDAQASQEMFGQLAERLDNIYGTSKPLDDHRTAQGFARGLLKLVDIIFKDGRLKECLGRGESEVKPDQLRGALISVAGVGN